MNSGTRCFTELAIARVVSFNCFEVLTPGASPVVLHYPVTVDLQSGNVVGLEELFIHGSGHEAELALSTLQFYVVNQPGEELIQKAVESRRNSINSYEYYLESECNPKNDVDEKFLGESDVCLVFSYYKDIRRHVIIPVATHDLRRFSEFFRPNGLLEEIIELD